MKKLIYIFSLLILSNMILGCFGKKSDNNYEKKKQNYIDEINQYSWNEPDKITSLIEPQIIVFDGKDKTKVGNSKFGGTPDLPDILKWPKFENKPMVFYAQLNLAEISNYHKEELLPTKGILYFFSYFKNPESEYGAEYLFQIDKQEYKVLFYDGNMSKLMVTEFPSDLILDYHFEEKSMEFELDFRLPASTYTWKFEKAKLTKSDAETYEKVIEEFDDYCESEMILGTPCPIQDPVEFDWAYSFLEADYSDDPKLKQKINNLRPQFINLLSFSMWGKFDTIGISNCYFGIRKEDLKAREFDNTIFIMQDT